jgi:hypothetical protein
MISICRRFSHAFPARPFQISKRFNSTTTESSLLNQHLRTRFTKGKQLEKRQSKKAEHPLNNPTKRMRAYVIWGSVFTGFFAWSVWYGRSIQMKNSPLFKGVMFTLRQDGQVKQWIGRNIEPSWNVEGFVNHIKVLTSELI